MVVFYPREGGRGECDPRPIASPHSCVPTQQFSIRCTNTTEKILAVRISVDSCYVQQYLLRPKGKAGDTVVCLGTGSHAMMFHLVSSKPTSPLLTFGGLFTVRGTS